MKKTLNLLFKIIKITITTLICGYIGIIIFLLHKENAMMYWGQNGKALMNHKIPKEFKEDTIKTSKSTLQYFKKEGQKNLPIVFYFGGNGEHANLSLGWLNNEFKENEVYSFNFPGYGKSTGDVGQKNIESALLEATTEISEGRNIILVGRSLGTGFTTYVASNVNNVDKIILITPFSKITDVACDRFIYIPSFICSNFMENRMDNVVNLSNVKKPILIIEVIGDTTIPNKNTQQLINSIPNAKVIKIKDTNHNSVMDHSDTINGVIDFSR